MISMAQSTISQHLKALLDAGLIQGEINPPNVRYITWHQYDRWRFRLLLLTKRNLLL
jgi:DNA-binding transcriptional ArsR family regulator